MKNVTASVLHLVLLCHSFLPSFLFTYLKENIACIGGVGQHCKGFDAPLDRSHSISSNPLFLLSLFSLCLLSLHFVFFPLVVLVQDLSVTTQSSFLTLSFTRSHIPSFFPTSSLFSFLLSYFLTISFPFSSLTFFPLPSFSPLLTSTSSLPSFLPSFLLCRYVGVASIISREVLQSRPIVLGKVLPKPTHRSPLTDAHSLYPTH